LLNKIRLNNLLVHGDNSRDYFDKTPQKKVKKNLLGCIFSKLHWEKIYEELQIKKNAKFQTRLAYVRELLTLAKLRSLAANSDGSFAGEYQYLQELTAKLDIKIGSVIDIAASDGYTQSSTLGFYRNGWGGLAVEMDPEKFSKLSYLYAKFPEVKLAKNRVTPNNIASLLEAFEISHNFTILNLDIDSYDLGVVRAMLSHGYFPEIISMEINEKIPPGIYFSVDFSEEHHWQGDHFYGCSIDAAAMTVKPFGYSLVSVQYNNAFFVRNSVVDSRFKDLTPRKAWELGYKDQTDRKLLFHWNSDVESWIESTPEQAVQMIDRCFQKYKGLYTLAVTSDLL